MSRKNNFCDCEIIHADMVKSAQTKMPENFYLIKIAKFYKILGDETRLKICFALSETELCVCDLANVLLMSKSSISHQLKILRENKIVKSRPSGKEIFYTLDDEHVCDVFNVSFSHIYHLNNGENCE